MTYELLICMKCCTGRCTYLAGRLAGKCCVQSRMQHRHSICSCRRGIPETQHCVAVTRRKYTADSCTGSPLTSRLTHSRGILLVVREKEHVLSDCATVAVLFD